MRKHTDLAKQQHPQSRGQLVSLAGPQGPRTLRHPLADSALLCGKGAFNGTEPALHAAGVGASHSGCISWTSSPPHPHLHPPHPPGLPGRSRAGCAPRCGAIFHHTVGRPSSRWPAAACLLIGIFPFLQDGKSNFWHVSTHGSRATGRRADGSGRPRQMKKASPQNEMD